MMDIMWPPSQSHFHLSFIFIEMKFYLFSFLCHVFNEVDVAQIPAQEPFLNEVEATDFAGPFKLNGPWRISRSSQCDVGQEPPLPNYES